MSFTQHCLAISPDPDYDASAHGEELLLALRGGSHAAFAELQSVYARRLYGRILSITRNREDAEDALQDTFLRAFLALPSFEGRSSLSTWLTRIAINSALMILRKRSVRPETSFEHPLSCETEVSLFDVPDEGPNPEQVYEQKQRLHAIVRAIDQLDPKTRTAIRIAALQERSMKQMAQDLRVSPASVKARLHRARKRLKCSSALRNLGMGHVRLTVKELSLRSRNRGESCTSSD